MEYNSETMPFMEHHFFDGKCLIPGAVLCDTMIQAVTMLDSTEQTFPIHVHSLEIYRAIHIAAKEAYGITLHVNRQNDDKYSIEMRGDIKNSKGKVVRKNVLITDATVSLGASNEPMPEEEQNKTIVHYSVGTDEFYRYFIRTHRELFQTLTGELSLNEDDSWTRTTFNIHDKESRFSEMSKYPFLISPLGLDSVLQTAVSFSVLSANPDGDYIYTKLPVGMRDLILYKPFEFSKIYKCSVHCLDSTQETLTLKIFIHNESDEVIGGIDKVFLKQAPFERYDTGGPSKHIEKFIVTEG